MQNSPQADLLKRYLKDQRIRITNEYEYANVLLNNALDTNFYISLLHEYTYIE